MLYNMNFKKGQRVHWNDPAIGDYDEDDIDYAINRIFVISDVDNRNGTAYIVEEDGGTEAEVYTDELELVEDGL